MRNWSLASGLCTFECLNRKIYCKFAKFQQIHSASYPGSSGHAVSEGSISCYLDNHVIYRVARFTYGVKCTREFEQNDPEHQQRGRGAFVNPSGKVFLPNGYQAILKKVRGITTGVPGYYNDYQSLGNSGFTGSRIFLGVRTRMQSPSGNQHCLVRAYVLHWGLG